VNVADVNEQQRRYREFLDLMPLTIALAGLPSSEPGKYYSDDQIEARLFTIRHAYKHARQIARECVQSAGGGSN
jgi:hypothetical protein